MELILVTLAIFLIDAVAEIHPKSVTVQEGEGFLIRLESPLNLPLQDCQMARNNKIYFFPPGQNKTQVLPSGEEAHTMFLNNNSKCGVRVLHVNSLSKGLWELFSLDEKGYEISGAASVQVTVPAQTCPQERCTVIDLKSMNQLPCHNIKPHWSKYKCTFASEGTITETQIEVGDKEHNRVRQPFVSDSGSMIFECKYSAQNSRPLVDCVMEHASSGRKFYIKEGLQGQRYSAYMSDFDKGTCQFEIPRDIRVDEIGLWEMIITPSHGYPHICRFQVDGNSAEAKENLIKRTQSTIVIKTAQENVTIKCTENVFYPIDVCYLVKESSVVWINEDEARLQFNENKAQLQLGRCEFVVGPGKWTCGFNGPTKDDAHFSQKFEVIKYETEVIGGAFNVHADGTVTMECHLVYKTPIQLCMFVSPSGRIFALPNDEYRTTNYVYYVGGKLATGDCGIRFLIESDVENGSWKCVIGSDNGNKLTSSILVSKEIDE